MRNNSTKKTAVQKQPGKEYKMNPMPESLMRNYKAAGKLKGRNAFISGGDSGIGRAVAIGFAKEGANVAICYLNEDKDAEITKKHIEEYNVKFISYKGDVGDPDFCRSSIKDAAKKFGSIDILVNNAGEQHVHKDLEEIEPVELERTFRTNIFSNFYLAQAALKFMKKGAAIINTASVVAYKGKEQLMDYAATKGAIVAFTRSLAKAIAKSGIRVNAVAPGPIWTPLIPASFSKEYIREFGKHTALGRPGQPDEVAPSYIFLASEDASYMTGQVLHPNGGEIVNG